MEIDNAILYKLLNILQDGVDQLTKINKNLEKAIANQNDNLLYAKEVYEASSNSIKEAVNEINNIYPKEI